MTLQITNAFDEKIDVEIGELEDISRITILVLSGDEILRVLKTDGSRIEEDSDRHFRTLNFYDGDYTIFDRSVGINRISEWKIRKNSNEWVRED